MGVGLVPGKGVGVRHVVSIHPPLQHVEGCHVGQGRDLGADASHRSAELQPETGTSQAEAACQVSPNLFPRLHSQVPAGGSGSGSGRE